MAENEGTQPLTDSEREALFHWAEYGQPGSAQTTRAQPPDADWAKPFSKPNTAPWRLDLDTSTLQKLILGFSPAEMEDKWLVFSTDPDQDGNLSVHMHRSWTGHKIIELGIEVSSGGVLLLVGDQGKARVTDITWETDWDIYRDDAGAEGAKNTAREVCAWVMGVDLPLEEEEEEEEEEESVD